MAEHMHTIRHARLEDASAIGALQAFPEVEMVLIFRELPPADAAMIMVIVRVLAAKDGPITWDKVIAQAQADGITMTTYAKAIFEDIWEREA